MLYSLEQCCFIYDHDSRCRSVFLQHFEQNIFSPNNGGFGGEAILFANESVRGVHGRVYAAVSIFALIRHFSLPLLILLIILVLVVV